MLGREALEVLPRGWGLVWKSIKRLKSVYENIGLLIKKDWVIVDFLLQETSFRPLEVLSWLKDRLWKYSQGVKDCYWNSIPNGRKALWEFSDYYINIHSHLNCLESSWTSMCLIFVLLFYIFGSYFAFMASQLTQIKSNIIN